MERRGTASSDPSPSEAQPEPGAVGWKLLADEVVARRVALGFRLRSDFARATGLATRTLGDIENARRVRYDKRTIAAVENALQWSPGTVARIVANGVPMFDSVQRRMFAMDLLYDHVPEGASSIPHFVDLIDGGELDEHGEGLWRATLRSLRDQDLINLAETMGFGGTAAWLTDSGRAEVEERRARRNDPVLRKSFAANSLIRWLYELDAYGDTFQQLAQIERTDRAVLEGERLPVDLFFSAADRLKRLGLVEAGVYVAEISGPLTAKLSDEGQELVESGRTVEDFVQDKRQRQLTNVTNFHGPVSGNVNWASSHVTQTAKTTTSGIAGEDLIALVRAIAEAVPALGLADDDAVAVTENTRVIQDELARSEPDRHIVKTYLTRTVDTLVGAGNSSLGLLLAGYAKEIMKAIGLPLG